MNSYRKLLSLPHVITLTLSAFPARLAYSVVSLGIFFHVLQVTDSIARAGLTIGANSVFSSLTAGVRGSIVDRYGQTWIISILGPLYGLCMVLFSFAENPTTLIVSAALLGASAPPINMSVRPLWKVIVPKELQRIAFSLDTTVMQALMILGPVIASWISLNFSGAWTMRVGGTSMIIGGIALASHQTSRTWVPEAKIPEEKGIFKTPGIRLLVVEGTFIGFGWGAFSVALPACATLAGKPEMAGTLIATMGIGTLIGMLLATPFTQKITSLKGMRISYALWTIACLPLFFYSTPSFLLLLIVFISGFVSGPLPIFYWEVLDAVRPRGTAVAAMGWVWTVEGSFGAFGSASAGSIAETHGAHVALAITPISVIIGFTLISFGRKLLAAADRIPTDDVSDEAILAVEDTHPHKND